MCRIHNTVIWVENVKIDKKCTYEVWWLQRRYGPSMRSVPLGPNVHKLWPAMHWNWTEQNAYITNTSCSSGGASGGCCGYHNGNVSSYVWVCQLVASDIYNRNIAKTLCCLPVLVSLCVFVCVLLYAVTCGCLCLNSRTLMPVDFIDSTNKLSRDNSRRSSSTHNDQPLR